MYVQATHTLRLANPFHFDETQFLSTRAFGAHTRMHSMALHM